MSVLGVQAEIHPITDNRPPVMDKRLLINRSNWNERTAVHAASAFYDGEGFRKGRITLNDIDRREVSEVSGKTLLHLQCHFGMDTMSWARLGAKATGVDFSDAAIDLARSLNDEVGANTRFILSDVYDLPDALDEEFDIVFTSQGVPVLAARPRQVGLGRPPIPQTG